MILCVDSFGSGKMTLLSWQESIMNEKAILAMTNSLFITKL